MATVTDLRSTVEDALKAVDGPGEPVRMTIELNGGMANLLDKLVELRGQDRSRAVTDALTALYITSTLHRDGLEIAAIDPEGEIQAVLNFFPES